MKALIWTGGIRIRELARKSGLKIGQSGRIIDDKFVRAEGHPFIYAIGDNALAINPITGKSVPTAAQFALQQGRLVAYNIYKACQMLSDKMQSVLNEQTNVEFHLAHP